MATETKPAAEAESVDWDTSRMVTDLIASQARMLGMLPLEALAAFLDRADSVGAIFDPTGFRQHGRSITAARRMVGATRTWIGEVQAAIEESRR